MMKRLTIGDDAMAKELLAQIEAERRQDAVRPPDLRRDMVELNVLRAFGAAVNERLEFGEILASATKHLPRLLDYGVLSVLVHGSKPELHVYPADGASPLFVHTSIRNLLDVSQQLQETPLDEADLAVFVDGSPRELGFPAGPYEMLQSHITLPLVSARETIGAVSVSSPRGHAFGPLDVQLFSLVTHQLSAAIRNSLLLRQSQEQAIRDPLTGAFNRRYFSERFEEELRRAIRYKHPLALVIGDVDHFKRINDGFGHQMGDEVLRCTARAMQEGLRTSDILCRYGGEEFVVLLPESTTEDAVLVAERLRALVPERARSTITRAKMRVHMSFGVTSTTGELEPTVDSLLAQADSALYFAKRSGRNQVCTPFTEAGALDGPRSQREQRRFPRTPTELALRYFVVPDLGEGAPSGGTIDIGTGGLRIKVDSVVPVGAFMLVDVDDGNGRPVRVLSKAVWVQDDPEGGARVGAKIVSFEGADEEERFERLVEEGPRLLSVSKSKPRLVGAKSKAPPKKAPPKKAPPKKAPPKRTKTKTKR
jgi:diguanylate cyclase (GGDEF)-like protein